MKLRIILPAAMAMILATGVAAPLRAQGIENRAVQGPVVKPPGIQQKSNAPPPGLPGAAVGGDRVTPSAGTSDLPPTEALFDAINRGDLNAARDAIARGADYNGRNILGLTPLDQSIDLSRNSITFLLLSLRGASPETVQSAKTLARSGKPSAPANGKAAPAAPPRSVAAKPVVPPVNGGPAVLATARSTQPLPQGPVDRGTPSPQNGFLGFGG
jgi:hypothetical protein